MQIFFFPKPFFDETSTEYNLVLNTILKGKFFHGLNYCQSDEKMIFPFYKPILY
jgi:hypothetical protein